MFTAISSDCIDKVSKRVDESVLDLVLVLVLVLVVLVLDLAFRDVFCFARFLCTRVQTVVYIQIKSH